MGRSDSSDLLVVGAGVIGLSIAWRAAERGLSVRVLERGMPGAGASSAAAGILAPTEPHEWEGARGELNLASMAAWRSFAEQLTDVSGLDVGYRRDGSLRIALAEEQLAGLEAVRAVLSAAGIEHAPLDHDACLREEPGLRGVLAGLLAPEDAHVDTVALVAALAAACSARGVELEAGVEPTSSLLDAEGRLEALSLSDGRTVSAGLIVACSGAWTAQARWLPPAVGAADVRPVAGEYVLASGPPDARVCRRIVRSVDGPVVPRRAGRYWIGTSVRDAGYATQPRLGTVADVLTRIAAFLPAVEDLQVERVGIGLRPATSTGMPLVGASDVAGLAWATGHGREGILQAPPTAEAIVGLATGEAPDRLFVRRSA
jgi:glycine oxidase